MASGTLHVLRTDLAYPVPWGLRASHSPGVHRLTNLGRHTLARVSITVLIGGVPAPGVSPGNPLALGPGESLEVRAQREGSTAAPQTVVVSWQRPDGVHYLWSTPI